MYMSVLSIEKKQTPFLSFYFLLLLVFFFFVLEMSDNQYETIVSTNSVEKRKLKAGFVEFNNESKAYLNCRFTIASSIVALLSISLIFLAIILAYVYEVNRLNANTTTYWISNAYYNISKCLVG